MFLCIHRQVLVAFVLFLSIGQAPTAGQTRDEVDAAIAKGVGWLLSAQTTDGSFRGAQFELQEFQVPEKKTPTQP